MINLLATKINKLTLYFTQSTQNILQIVRRDSNKNWLGLNLIIYVIASIRPSQQTRITHTT